MTDMSTIYLAADSTDIKRGTKDLRGMAAQAGDTERKVTTATGKMESSFGSMRSAIGLVSSALASLGVTAGTMKLVSVAREFDIINAGLKTATGSAEEAARAFEDIQELAQETPFALQEVADALVRLRNYGLDPSRKALVAYGDTAAAMGKSLNQVIEAVADAATGEFERLKEFGIRASKQGDEVAFTFRGLTTTVAMNAEAIQGYLISLGETSFGGAMVERMNTLDGAISNLGDAWDKMFLAISQGGAGKSIENGIRSITEGIEWLTKNIDHVIAGIAGIAKAASTIVALKIGAWAVSAAKNTAVLTAAMSALGGPVGLVAAGIAVLITSARSLAEAFGLVKTEQEKLMAQQARQQRRDEAVLAAARLAIQEEERKIAVVKEEIATMEEWIAVNGMAQPMAADAMRQEIALRMQRVEQIRAETQAARELVAAQEGAVAATEAQTAADAAQFQQQQEQAAATGPKTGIAGDTAAAEMKAFRQSIADKYAAQVEMEEQQRLDTIARQQEFNDLMYDVNASAAERQLGYDMATAEARAKFENDTRKGLLSEAATMNKQAFEANKIASTAEAVVNTYKAASSAFSDTPGPIWVKLAAAGTALMQGFKLVKQIQSAKFGGGGGGGGGISGGAGRMAGQSVTPQQPAEEKKPKQDVNITVQGGLHSDEDVRNLASRIGDVVADAGINLNVMVSA